MTREDNISRFVWNYRAHWDATNEWRERALMGREDDLMNEHLQDTAYYEEDAEAQERFKMTLEEIRSRDYFTAAKNLELHQDTRSSI